MIKAVQIDNQLRDLFPQTAPFVSQIQDIRRQMMLAMMQNAQPAEAASPPVAG